jgi:hypothetical protein
MICPASPKLTNGQAHVIAAQEKSRDLRTTGGMRMSTPQKNFHKNSIRVLKNVEFDVDVKSVDKFAKRLTQNKLEGRDSGAY